MLIYSYAAKKRKKPKKLVLGVCPAWVQFCKSVSHYSYCTKLSTGLDFCFPESVDNRHCFRRHVLLGIRLCSGESNGKHKSTDLNSNTGKDPFPAIITTSNLTAEKA